MAASYVVNKLEEAAQTLLAPPGVVTRDQRQAAENVFLAFRKSPMPYALCTAILESSKDNYVLFQVASTIKECIIRDWSLLQPSDIESMRCFLLRYVTHNIVIQSYVREQLLQTIAVIVKRGTLDSSTNDRGALFDDIAKLISTGTLSEQLVACTMLCAQLTEYANTSCSSSVGLTWEFHHKCKVIFEETDLKRAFVFCLQVLHELDSMATPLTREVTAVFNRVLAIAQQIFSWEFLPRNIPRRLIGSFKPSQNVSFKPPFSWRDVVLDHGLVDMMFRIHQKVRLNPEMSVHSRQCLSQLASLNGPIFSDVKSRVNYLTRYIEMFLQLVTSTKVERHECLDIANIVNNVMIFYPVCVFTSLPPEMLSRYIEQLTKITCQFCQEAALEEAMHQDDTIYQEAYEKLLDSWMCFTLETNDMPEGSLTQPSTDIINTYLQCHLSPPDGTRRQTTSEDGEYEEVEEDDREKFRDQLCSIGAFGRLVPQHFVPLLSGLLEQRVSRLQGQLQRLSQVAAGSPSGGSSELDTSVLNSINEDIHWLLLVSAYLLTDIAEGETPMIPAPMMQYSMSLAHVMDVETTLKVLASPSQEARTIPGSDRGADPVVRLISAVFRLCQVEKQHSTEYLSPQVESSTMWFFARWVPTYLLPNETYYTQMSLALTAAFGRDTDGGQWTIAYLLDKVFANLNTWCSEPDVITDTLDLLIAMVDKKERSDCVVKCETIWKLAKGFAANGHPFDMLSAPAHRHLCKALVLVGSATFDDNRQDTYWQLVLTSVHERFQRVLTLPNLKKVMHEASVKNEVISLLESLCGVTEATRINNVSLLFQFLQPALIECVNILDLYHSYEDVVHLVLELFNTVANQQLCYLGENDTKKVYERTLSVIQLYAKYNIGRRHVRGDAEEDQFLDLSLLMAMLTNLLSKDFIDFGFTGDNDAPDAVTVNAADVVSYGLNIVVPLMTTELLKFPSLCLGYMRLVAYITEVHPDKIAVLPDPLLKTLMESVESALLTGGADVIRLCLDFLTSMATYIHQNNLAGSYAHNTLEHFLQLVFKMLLLEPFDMDLLETASPTFFCLICCHQHAYQTLVHSLISKQSDGATYQRLVEAFSALTGNEIQLKIDRANKNRFMENFDEFLKNVRGFLCVK